MRMAEEEHDTARSVDDDERAVKAAQVNEWRDPCSGAEGDHPV